MNLPDYLILGETKCGTTSLYNYLVEHPKIIDTKGNHITYDKDYNTKEIRYFDRYYDKGIDWYKSCFHTTNKNEITGEATPMYFYRTISINRIKETIPDAKFIVLLRDPVLRLFSNFNHNYKWVPQFKEKYPSFEIFWNSVHDTDYYLIEKGMYYYTLIKWFEHFKNEQFCIIKSEDLYNDTQKSYENVIRFLGLQPYILQEIKVYRKNEYEENPNIEIKKKVQSFYSPYNKKLIGLIGDKFNWNY